jgi:hypothetical protein
MSANPNLTPHREPKVTRFPVHFKIPLKPGGEARIPVKAGTPLVEELSVSPYTRLVLSCSDEVENKGHQFGVDLKA